MHQVIPLSIRVHHDGYCSQTTALLPPIRTIEEGVTIIEGILKKKILCRHDIKAINQAFQAIDLLERSTNPIPERNSQHALNIIIKKVERIFDNKNAEGLISLYYLQEFSDKGLDITRCFTSLSKNFKKTQEHIDAVATHLPYCYSKAEFDKAASVLIGANPSDNVSKILEHKREKLQSHQSTIQAVAERKIALRESRKSEPQNFPAYFDELLDNGYIHLYDHLIQMRALSQRNDRRSHIQKMTFSQISHVVLETREAIIQKVENSIPHDRQNILFLLGGSGAGKSTALCFLRGDVMVLKKDFHYKSQNERSGLIGDEGATSYTFLPTVEIVNDLVIVDFAGFDDTNGQIISLGMEFALKALIKRYQPKILVLESITNTDGKFAAAAQLGSRLSRLLGNKENCLLGITKYSKNSNFGKIRAIEEQQKKERSNPTQEESKLIGKIEYLSEENDPASKPKIEQLKQQLAKMKQERAQELLPLPETDEKKEQRKLLQETENELLKQIGLGSIIRFSDLEDPNHLATCLATLTKLPKEKSIGASLKQTLNEEDEGILKYLFTNNLLKVMETKTDYAVDFRDFKVFEQRVLESSLINTVFSQSNPEIGQFLHLPEINPTIVQGYDKTIVDSCIRNYMNAVISSLNISLIEQILAKLPNDVNKNKVAALKTEMERVRGFIKGLLGEEKTLRNAEQANIEWNRIRREHQAAAEAVGEAFKLPTWATVLLFIPLAIPIGIRKLVQWNAQNNANKEANEKTIDNCCEELKKMYGALVELNGIKKMIQTKEAIDEIFTSVPISMNSTADLNASIQVRINKVRNKYGPEDWDSRVSLMADQFKLTHFDPKNSAHVNCISAYAYWLIEPDLSCVYNPLGKTEKLLEASAAVFVELESNAEALKMVLGNKGAEALEKGLKNALTNVRPQKWEEHLTNALKAAAWAVRKKPGAELLARAEAGIRMLEIARQRGKETINLFKPMAIVLTGADALARALAGVDAFEFAEAGGWAMAQADALAFAKAGARASLELLADALELAFAKAEAGPEEVAFAKEGIEDTEWARVIQEAKAEARAKTLTEEVAKSVAEAERRLGAEIWSKLWRKIEALPGTDLLIEILLTRAIARARARDELSKVLRSVPVAEEWKGTDFFELSIHKNSDRKTRISIVGLGDMPKLAQDISGPHYNGLPVTRALSAAAILKAHEKWLPKLE